MQFPFRWSPLAQLLLLNVNWQKSSSRPLLLKGHAEWGGVAGLGASSHKKGLGTADSNHSHYIHGLLTLSQLLSEHIWCSQPSYPCYNFTGKGGKSLA